MSALIFDRMGPKADLGNPLDRLSRNGLDAFGDLLEQFAEEFLERRLERRRRRVPFGERFDLLLNQSIVTRAELPGHRVDHRLRFTNQIGEVLRDDAIGVLLGMAGPEMIGVQVAGVGQQLEERFVELFIVEFLHHR